MLNIICFFLGFIAYPYINHLPFPNLAAVHQAEAEQKPTAEDLKRLEYVKECQRYGFSEPECENFWDGIPN